MLDSKAETFKIAPDYEKRCDDFVREVNDVLSGKYIPNLNIEAVNFTQDQIMMGLGRSVEDHSAFQNIASVEVDRIDENSGPEMLRAATEIDTCATRHGGLKEEVDRPTESQEDKGVLLHYIFK